jgi:hypothetical protein
VNPNNIKTNNTSTTSNTTIINTNTTKPKVKTNWDGKVVKAGPWYDKELFQIWGKKVTAKEVGGMSAGAIAAIVLGVLSCCYCSWRKREAIADGARRASTFIG